MQEQKYLHGKTEGWEYGHLVAEEQHAEKSEWNYDEEEENGVSEEIPRAFVNGETQLGQRFIYAEVFEELKIAEH